MVKPPRSITTGWKPSCSCDAGDPVPATVLDPFAGSGTTVMVANQLGRRGVGMELSRDYLALAKERTGLNALEGWQMAIDASEPVELGPLFAEVEG